MGFSPNHIERLARARSDLRMGVPVVIDAPEPVLIVAAETLNEARLSDLRGLRTGIILAVTARRAATLKSPAYDGDVARFLVPQDVPLSWIHAVTDPADDLASPMKGPLQAIRGGDPSAYRSALQLAKSARLLPAVVASPLERARDFAEAHGLVCLEAAQISDPLTTAQMLHEVISARLPTVASETGRLHIFRPEDGGEEHYAMEIGRPDRRTAVLTRLHSACFTGDLMGSLKCDCGPQLQGALAQMGREGSGILLYMNQEGRGIGLANKMRAYALQDQGFDTVEANHRLGFEDDERDFRLGSDILRKLGVSRVKLMTNNPRKVAMMQASGIDVAERVPLKVGANPHNEGYLATKVAKSGHLE